MYTHTCTCTHIHGHRRAHTTHSSTYTHVHKQTCTRTHLQTALRRLRKTHSHPRHPKALPLPISPPPGGASPRHLAQRRALMSIRLYGRRIAFPLPPFLAVLGFGEHARVGPCKHGGRRRRGRRRGTRPREDKGGRRGPSCTPRPTGPSPILPRARFLLKRQVSTLSPAREQASSPPYVCVYQARAGAMQVASRRLQLLLRLSTALAYTIAY